MVSCIRTFAWQWKPADKPQLSSEDQWHQYSTIDNEIIEDAFNKKKPYVEIDDGILLDFTLQIQYTKNDEKNRCSIRRTELARNNDQMYLREERFSMPIAMTSSKPQIQKLEDSDESEFCRRKSFSYTYFYNEVMDKGKTIADVIEEAADGIIKEGGIVGKPHQAQRLAQKLIAVKRLGHGIAASLKIQGFPYGISQICIDLYTSGSFWYKRFNAVLREWTIIPREQIKTCGPFALLLINSVVDFATEKYVTVYRGIDLTDEQRHELMANAIRFDSFTSTSKNRTLAEWYGNTLLILNINSDFSLSGPYIGADISYYSHFPDEDEFLLLPGTDFFCDQYDYDTENQRHLVYLYNC